MDAVRPALPGLSPVEPVASFCEPHGSCENQHFGKIGTAHDDRGVEHLQNYGIAKRRDFDNGNFFTLHEANFCKPLIQSRGFSHNATLTWPEFTETPRGR
mgnify:FL=1